MQRLVQLFFRRAGDTVMISGAAGVTRLVSLYFMNTDLSGNLPGRKVFWKSPDGKTEIIRYCDGVFGLEYNQNEVMTEASFEKINAYAWAEFITL